MQGNTAEGLKDTGVGGGGLHVHIRESVSSHTGTHGFSAVDADAAGAAVFMRIDRSESTFNGADRVRVNGATSVNLGFSTVMGNGTGLSKFNGGQIFSCGTNTVFDNTVDVTPIA